MAGEMNGRDYSAACGICGRMVSTPATTGAFKIIGGTRAGGAGAAAGQRQADRMRLREFIMARDHLD